MAVLEPDLNLIETSQLYSFTYRDLLEMERRGIIAEDEHVELLGGHIFRMTIHPLHAVAVTAFSQQLGATLFGQAVVFSQNPLRLSDALDDRNLPQPDVMVTKNRV